MINIHIKGAFKLGDIDGYDEYEDNLWKETTKGKDLSQNMCQS